MTNFFGEIKKDSTASQREDVVGGFEVLPSGIYPVKVIQAYGVASKSSAAKAIRLVLEAQLENGVRPIYLDAMWVTNKEGSNFSEKDGVKTVLPSYTLLNGLANIICNKSLEQLEVQMRTITFGDKAVEVPMFIDLLDKRFAAALKRVRKNKQAKDSSGNWVDTAEETFSLELDAVLTADGFSPKEIRENASEAEFYKEWLKANKDKDRNRYKEVKTKATSSTGAQVDFG